VLILKKDSNLHLGFIHISREVGHNNFLNGWRAGIGSLGGICYPSLSSGGCTGSSKNLSAGTTTGGPALYLFSHTGSSNNLQNEQKKKIQKDAPSQIGDKRTSSRDLSIAMSVKVALVKVRTKSDNEERVPWLVGWLVEGVKVKRHGASNNRETLGFIFLYLHSSGVGNRTTAVSLCSPFYGYQSCLELLAAAVVEVSGVEVELASEQTTRLPWVSHLPIYKPCQESRALSILYVIAPIMYLHPEISNLSRSLSNLFPRCQSILKRRNVYASCSAVSLLDCANRPIT